MTAQLPQQEIITPELAEAADYIMAAWRGGIESLIETGRRLVEVRTRFDNQPGMWSRLIGAHQWDGRGLLPFGRTHTQRLVKIYEKRDRLCPHVGTLPSDSFTLYELTRLTDERFDQLMADGRINPGMKRNDASAETRLERVEEDEDRILNLRPIDGKFRGLVLDCAWDYEWLSIAARAAPGYATQTIEQLLALDVAAWADEEAGCHLYCWTTNNFMAEANKLVAHWGFQHRTVITWIKPPPFGLGSYFRNSTEHIIFATRDGRTKTTTRPPAASIPTHFEAPRGEHSEKPERFYEIVRAASYPPFGEGNQREPREDFTNLFEDANDEAAE
jgi:N6-adenosine-specific RNA methylase IME4